MPLDGSTPFAIPVTARPAQRMPGFGAKEWAGFLVALGLALALSGALALVTLRFFAG